jgi:dsDNA-specific endonuclease/ATPase MutS2
MSGERKLPGPEPRRIPIEDHIDLHAFVPKEIPSVVQDYLEEAARAGFRQVRIIHGRGTGTQRRIVRAVLARHPLVESCRDAPPEAGGWGATVVVLRID